MLSAINNNNSTTSFTSVVPVRVRVDGKESYSEYFIRPACKKLFAILLGPTKLNEKHKLDIIETFAKHDKDYKYNLGVIGHKLKDSLKKAVPSDYFRYVCHNFEHYLITGIHAQRLKEFGKQVGVEKHAGKILDVDNSLDIEVARGNYWAAMKNFIKNKKLRITEHFNTITGQRTGAPVALVLDMKSNGKYGQSNFKMDIEKISFEPILQ